MIDMAEQINDSSQIINDLQKIRISENSIDCEKDAEKWGLPLTEVYKLAISFYKGWFHC